MAKDIEIYGKVKAQETMLVLPVPQVLRGDMVISDVNGEKPSLSLWGWGVLHAFLSLTHHVPNNGGGWLKFNLLGLASVSRSSLQAYERTNLPNCCT